MTPQPSEQPRSVAGRAHFQTFVDNQHHDNVDAAYECSDDVDRCDSCAQEVDDILAIEAEAAAPDPVASPLNGDVLAWHDRLPHQQKGCPICEHGLIGSPDPTHNHDGGDGHCRSSCPLWTEALSRVAASADDIDPVSRPTPPVASPAPLDVERLARALIESDLMPLYREYAMRVPTMDPSETVEHLAAVWAGWVAAAYAAEGQPAADPAVLADQIVDEGRVSAFGPPGTTFTPERQAKGQPVAEEPR